ncbi:hypothetical protein HS041_07195 [Planomonospora sp. ID67723]|uniref:hypothetical protein n=1 Tax=Planomonospora sp. ID67723 TaxID=2738134 RepID=UPI0018C3AB53|nr:hypothetical protein [Planomonospora sp. ID67723]MBG0827547.1 hypothetical protein [Planomonospora sp. ID67723]
MNARALGWESPCPSLHLPPVRDEHRALTWYGAARFGRVRVVAWTCHQHRVTFYELCEAGGLAFIRRTVDRDGGRAVSYSEAWSCRRAREMWSALVAGLVR